jgi:hypothetical protein
MNVYIFDVHVNYCFVKENKLEDGHEILNFDLVQCGPLNRIKSNNFKKVRKAFLDISSSSIKSNWWTEFSSWDNFKALLLTGSKLSIHTVVANLRRDFKCLQNANAYIETIDDNGDIVVQVDEAYEDLIQGFTLQAKRRRLRRLSDLAAFNIAQYLESESDVDCLEVPRNLKTIVKQFLVTYSEDYIVDLKKI